MSVGETVLPDHFENEQAMEALVEKVYGDMATKEAAEAPDAVAATEIPVAAAETVIETPPATEQESGDEHSAETPPAAESSEGQGTVTPPESQDWLDADLRYMATAAGIPEGKLGEFSSRQELERVMDILDARAVEAGRQALAMPAETPPVETPPVTPPAAEPKALKKSETPSEEVAQFLLPDEYDEGVVKPHNEFVKAMDARLKAESAKVQALADKLTQYEVKEQQREHRAIVGRFTSIADSLGHPELFGTADKRTAEQQANLSKLWDQHRAHVAGMAAIGRRGETNKPFVERALYAEFGPQLTKLSKQQAASALRAQSAKRMGGPSGKSNRTIDDGTGPDNNPAVMAELIGEYNRLLAGSQE